MSTWSLLLVSTLVCAANDFLAIDRQKLFDGFRTLYSKCGDALSVSDPVPPNGNSEPFTPLHIELEVVFERSPKHGDILDVSNLKQQQDLRLQTIARCMNNSYGVVMKKTRKRRRNRTEIRLKWIMNQEIKASIKLKYLTKQFPNIYIHHIGMNDWYYVSNLTRSLLENKRNLIINQISDMSLASNPNIMHASLVHPLLHKIVTIHSMKWDNIDEIKSLLSRLPYHFSPKLFDQIMSRLYVSKTAKMKSIRTKLLPKLKHLYTELYEIYFEAFNLYEQKLHPLLYLKNYTLQMVEVALGPFLDLQQKEYAQFYIMLRDVITNVCNHEIGQKIPMKLASKALKNPWRMHLVDVINVYWKALMDKQDIHILCTGAFQWHYGDIARRLAALMISMNVDPCYRQKLSEAIIKVVLHDDDPFDISPFNGTTVEID